METERDIDKIVRLPFILPRPLFGLWHSTVTPNADRLLTTIVHDLLVLRSGGLLIDLADEGKPRFYLFKKIAKCDEL
jgi:hypothetical protein